MEDIISWEFQQMKAEKLTQHITQLVKQVTITDRLVAIGNDLVHLPTFTKSCTSAFIRRVFTPNELAYCLKFSDRYLRYASTWAAKEAAYKAIKQTDDSIKLWWRDIEIVRAKAAGKPTVQIKKLKIPLEFSLSISHEEDYVWAVVFVCFAGN